MPGKENNAAISAAVVGRSPCLVREFYVIIIIIIIIPSVCALPLVYLLPVYIYPTCFVRCYLFFLPSPDFALHWQVNPFQLL